MYLVQLTLAPPGDAHPPAELARALHDAAPDVVEHAGVHTPTRSHLVVSLFLRAASLDEAEAAARRIWQRATASRPSWPPGPCGGPKCPSTPTTRGEPGSSPRPCRAHAMRRHRPCPSGAVRCGVVRCDVGNSYTRFRVSQTSSPENVAIAVAL